MLRDFFSKIAQLLGPAPESSWTLVDLFRGRDPKCRFILLVEQTDYARDMSSKGVRYRRFVSPNGWNWYETISSHDPRIFELWGVEEEERAGCIKFFASDEGQQSLRGPGSVFTNEHFSYSSPAPVH